MIVNLLKQIVAQLQVLLARPASPDLESVLMRLTEAEQRILKLENDIGDVSDLPDIDGGAEDPQGDLDSLPKL